MKIVFRPADAQGKKGDVEIEVNAEELIESLRLKVGKKMPEYEVHKLTYRGVNLKEDKTLRSYEVPDGATVIVQAQFHGQYLPLGVQPSMEKRPVEDLDAVEEVEPEAKRRAVELAAKDVSEADIKWIGARCATAGDKGMRRQMEDETLICTSLRDQCPGLSEARDCALFAIFDGHGGRQVAGFIKTFLAMELGSAFMNEEGDKERPLSDKRLKKAVEGCYQRLDSRIATELPGCYDGCTATVLLVNKEQSYCVNLGDSGTFLCRTKEGDLQAVPLQRGQHKCWMMKEKERILRSGGAVENGRINGILEVSRAFGDITLKKYGVLCTPEYMKFKMERSKDQFIIMGCDGFWSNWTPAEALEYTTEVLATEQARANGDEEPVNLKDVCGELVQHVVEEKKSQDNVSVLILQFTDDAKE